MIGIAKKSIKSYVIRAGRLSNLQKNAIEAFSDRYCIPFQEKLLDFKSIFGNGNSVIIEIGFGMGHATLEIAEKYRNKNFIGIEVHTPGVGKLLNCIDHLHLSNLRIIQYDAVEVIRAMIPEESLSGVHIFFPDPWQKKKHHKRRLIQHSFIKKLIPLIKKNGYIYVVTDWKNYAKQILSVFSQFPEISKPNKPYSNRIDWRPKTNFENKGIAKNHVIWNIRVNVK